MIRKISPEERVEMEREAVPLIPGLRKKIIESSKGEIEIEAVEIKKMLGPRFRDWDFIDIMKAEPFYRQGKIVIGNITENPVTLEDYFLMYIEQSKI